MSAVANEDTTLVMTRMFDAPPENVFDAWTDHDEFKAWIGPEGVSCDVPTFEPRVGGRYEIAMRMSTGEVIPTAGIFKEMDRPHRLVFTWGWRDLQSLVTLAFRAVGEKTEMTLRQEGLGTGENHDTHGQAAGTAPSTNWRATWQAAPQPCFGARLTATSGGARTKGSCPKFHVADRRL